MPLDSKVYRISDRIMTQVEIPSKYIIVRLIGLYFYAFRYMIIFYLRRYDFDIEFKLEQY